MTRRAPRRVGCGVILVAGLLAAGVCPADAAITLKIAITPSSISFPDANPSTTPSISASSTASITVTVTGALKTDRWSVGALAPDDLISGSNRIPIANISWTVALAGGSCPGGCNGVAGAMSKSVPQNMAVGQGNTSKSGVIFRYSFSLANSWSYKVGSYSQVVTITATSP